MRLSRPFGPVGLAAAGLLLAVLTAVLVVAITRPPLVAERYGVPAGPVARAPATTIQETRPAAMPTALLSPDDDQATDQPSPTPQRPTPTPTETATAAPTAAATAAATAVPPTEEPPATESPGLVSFPSDWRRVEVDELGLAFLVPESWQRLGAAWAWAPAEDSAARVGLAWSETGPEWEPTMMLAEPYRVVTSAPVDLGWAQGRSYRVELLLRDEAVAVERHAIVQDAVDLAYDFFASGRTLSDLQAVEPVLQRMLASATLHVMPGGPTDVSIRFLSCLLRDALSADCVVFMSAGLQDAVPAGGSPLSLLGVQEAYYSFYVELLPADGRVRLAVALSYPGGVVEERIFTLVKQGGEWRIDAIDAPS